MSRTFAVYGTEGFDPGPEVIPEGWRIVEGAVWVPRPVTIPERLPLHTGGIEVLWSIQVVRGPSGHRNEAPDDRDAEAEWRYTAVEPHLPWTHAWALHTGDVDEAPMVVVTGRVRNGGKVQVKTMECPTGEERPTETSRPEAPTLREALLREAARYTGCRAHIPDVVDTLDQQAQEETASR